MSAPLRDRTFPTLNAVRAAGAAMVVLTHVGFNTGRITQGWTGAMLSRFDFGVALFFVVSGFLLARPAFRARLVGGPLPRVGHYLWKRALRILPLYWVVVVVALLVDPANRRAPLSVWVSHLTLTQLYRPAPLASSLTQMWSLCTEVAFYLLLPLLLPLLLGRARSLDVRRVLWWCAGLSLVGLAWAAAATSILGSASHAGQWLPAYLPWFLTGVALAACSADPATAERLDRAAADLAGWWVLAVALFALACSDLAGPRLLTPPTAWQAVVKCALYGAAAGAVVFPLVFGPERGGPLRARLAGPIPQWLGDISYGVFSIHMLVLVVGMRVLGVPVFSGSFWPVLTMTALVSVVAAGFSYRWLERPFLRLKDVGPFARRDPATSAQADKVAP
jgi:peptidoglycan/LPS O-acetylase OafA/YrhL